MHSQMQTNVGLVHTPVSRSLRGGAEPETLAAFCKKMLVTLRNTNPYKWTQFAR